MHTLDLPAGSAVRFTATSRPDWDSHRWDLRVVASGGGPVRLGYGSQIGGRDVHQSLDIPAQDVDCRIEVQSRHRTPGGWTDDRPSPRDDTPDRLLIGYYDASRPGARGDDLLLSFAFSAAPAAEEPAHGQGPEEIQPRDAQAQAGEGQAAADEPRLP